MSRKGGRENQRGMCVNGGEWEGKMAFLVASVQLHPCYALWPFSRNLY